MNEKITILIRTPIKYKVRIDLNFFSIYLKKKSSNCKSTLIYDWHRHFAEKLQKLPGR